MWDWNEEKKKNYMNGLLGQNDKTHRLLTKIVFLNLFEVAYLIFLIGLDVYSFLKGKIEEKDRFKAVFGLRYLVWISFNGIMIILSGKAVSDYKFSPKIIQRIGAVSFILLSFRMLTIEFVCQQKLMLRTELLLNFDWDGLFLYLTIFHIFLITTITVHHSYGLIGQRIEYYYNRKKFIQSIPGAKELLEEETPKNGQNGVFIGSLLDTPPAMNEDTSQTMDSRTSNQSEKLFFD